MRFGLGVLIWMIPYVAGSVMAHYDSPSIGRFLALVFICTIHGRVLEKYENTPR